VHAQDELPSDKNATKETINLYRNMKTLAKKGFMFGHQDDLAYGVNWRYKDDHSDVKEASGDYPAVYGWDLGGIERTNNEKNIDGIPFQKMKKFIKEGYQRGGVITISWHADSPLGAEKGSWDTTHGTVASILPGGTNHDLYKSWLDKVSGFLGSLKGDEGEAIPVLFRPFHEFTGNWFWWCQNTCSEFEFETLWKFTNYYLREVKDLHNLLYVYNTSGDFKTKEEFLQRYPGDDVVDMLSLDTYQYDDPAKSDAFAKSTNKALGIVAEAAREKGKLMALSETGYEAIPYPEWWTKTLLNAIGDNPISYVLVWRNHGYADWNKKMHYYAPFKGQLSEEDFKKFYKLDRTIFEKEAKEAKLYKDSLISSS
jgi:mannan endo-1,4-beta-mannosidase